MAKDRKLLGTTWVTTPLFYHTSGVGYVVSHWFFGLSVETQAAYLCGREDIVTSHRAAYLCGYIETIPPHYILGNQDRYTTSLFYPTSGVETIAGSWFFSIDISHAHAYMTALSFTALVAQLWFSIPTANEKHSVAHAYIPSEATVQDAHTAYMNAGTAVFTSSKHAYLFCQMDATGVAWGYLRGFLTTSTSGTAYLNAMDSGKLIGHAYLSGYSHVKGNQKAFTWGWLHTLSAIHAYTQSNILARDSRFAYTRSGTDAQATHQAYLWCDYSRSSVHAYAEGLSPNPVSVKPAYLQGGGEFPFTDDFTGADSNPWNVLKWITEEHT